ncbi:hypothetical protein AB4160_18425 [Shewanella sp. 10N.286.51.B8]|uniref:hypothetical protein n=1 Tax=Shewanella sp. 10N.286.51.B8 TaxID=3229708 RepID=UPI003552D5CD
MAGERRGKVLELIVAASFQLRTENSYTLNKIVLDSHVEGLRWKPDVFLELLRDKNLYSILGLITYAGSENDSQQKFWRNICEVKDFKSNFTSGYVFSFIAGGRIRGKILKAQESLFDCVFNLDEYFVDLNSLLQEFQSENSSEKIVELINGKYKEDLGFKSCVNRLSMDVYSCLSVKCVNSGFWDELIVTGKSFYPTPRNTYYRRGITKSALFTKVEISELKKSGRLKSKSRVDLVLCGILKDKIGGLSLDDKDIEYAIENISNLYEVIEFGLSDVGKDSVDKILNSRDIKNVLNHIKENYIDFTNAEKLEQYLYSGLDEFPSKTVFIAIKAILAEVLGRQGQGWLEEVSDKVGVVKSVLIGIDIPRFERGERDLKSNLRTAIADSLSQRLGKVKFDSVEVDSVLASFFKKEIETRLICHGMDPIKSIVLFYLKENNICYEESYLDSAISISLGFSGRDLSMRGIWAGDVFIHWRSVTKAGKTHKLKEISSRCFQGRKLIKNNRFVASKHPKYTVLIVDGEWAAEDFLLLKSHGWDYILYPDQLNKLDEIF